MKAEKGVRAVFGRWRAFLFPGEEDRLPVFGAEEDGKTETLRGGFARQCRRFNRIPALLTAVLFLLNALAALAFDGAAAGWRLPAAAGAAALAAAVMLYHLWNRGVGALLWAERGVSVLWLAWGGLVSAQACADGGAAYLLIELIAVQALLFRGDTVFRILAVAGGYLLFAAALLIKADGASFKQGLFADLLHPLGVTAVSAVLLAIRDSLLYRTYCRTEEEFRRCEALESDARSDFLTRVANRRSICEFLDGQIADGEQLCCMMADIDNFKLYNDTCGHLPGDECLVRVSEVMERSAARYGGRLGRYGGEEFLLVLPGMTAAAALSAARELVRAVEESAIWFGSRERRARITVSVGVALREPGDAIAQDLIRRADQAMYTAKSQGKNRACLHSPTEDLPEEKPERVSAGAR